MAFHRLGDYADAQQRAETLWYESGVWKTIDAWEHTVAVCKDGTVLACGINGKNQCDVGEWEKIVSVAVGKGHSLGLRKDGTVIATAYKGYKDRTSHGGYKGQCDVQGWSNIVAIAAGSEHSLGLRADGTVIATDLLSYRSSSYGQEAVNDWTNIVFIAAGHQHSVGVKADGSVVAVGDNTYGQCDVEDWTDIVAVAAGKEHTVGLRKDGTLVATGQNHYGECNVSEFEGVQFVSCNSHTYDGGGLTSGTTSILSENGTVTVIGSGLFQRTKTEDWTDVVAVAAGSTHTVGVCSDGTAIAVGFAGERSYGRSDVSELTNIRIP